ncbi:MAG: hypothetical protein AAFN77_10905 [Planctomycetota bacterium]
MPTRKPIAQILADITDVVQSTFQENLVALVHYGPTVERDQESPNPRHDPIRLMLVLQTIDDACLEQLADLDPVAIEQKQTEWLTLSEHELHRSTDVFPELFLEIKRRFEVISGSDVLKDLDIGHHHLRLRCEQQFKTLLFELQHDLQVKPKDHHLRLAEQFLRFVEIAGGTLWLAGLQPPEDSQELLRVATEELGIELEQIERVRKAIDANRLTKKNCLKTQIDFIGLVRIASNFVDAMDDEIIVVETE